MYPQLTVCQFWHPRWELITLQGHIAHQRSLKYSIRLKHSISGRTEKQRKALQGQIKNKYPVLVELGKTVSANKKVTSDKWSHLEIQDIN